MVQKKGSVRRSFLAILIGGVMWGRGDRRRKVKTMNYPLSSTVGIRVGGIIMPTAESTDLVF